MGMTREEAIKYGTEWLKDEYLDAKDGAFIKKAIEALKLIPDNATNGDVIKKLFSNAICIQEDTFVYIYKNKKKFELKAYLTKVSKKWWNALYKAESEDKNEQATI